MKKTNRIMRKSLALLLFFAMLVSCCAAFAEGELKPFDLKTYEDNPDYFTIDIDTEDDLAFIQTTYDAASLAFIHKYDSDYYYSFLSSDILVIDYSKEGERVPVFRTWIYYAADAPQNITSVTFEIDGKAYTFTDIADPERNEVRENGYSENLVIKYGIDNWDFFTVVAANAMDYILSEDENAAAPEMKMILHGDEEIEAVVPENFWADFSFVIAPFLADDGDWLQYLVQNSGTPCEIADLAPAAE